MTDCVPLVRELIAYLCEIQGGKNRRRGKNENDDDKRELVFREDGQEYAQVTKMLGNGRLEAQCFDGEKRLAHIRGKMRKKVRFYCYCYCLHRSAANNHGHRCGLTKETLSFFPFGISKTIKLMLSSSIPLMKHVIVCVMIIHISRVSDVVDVIK
jgi:hypothetical protein